MELNLLLLRAVSLGASDVHLKAGQPPVVRRDGVLEPMEGWPPLGPRQLEAVLDAVTDAQPHRRNDFLQTSELDIAYATEGLPRFRVNGFRQRGAISFAFRSIPAEVPSFDELRLPPGV